MKKALFFCFLFALSLTTAVRAQSPCEEPSNITITPGATSATVSWTGSSAQYNVQYSFESFYCGADVDCVSDWFIYDVDGDGYNWYLDYMGRSGADDDIAFVSDSYYYGALDPDNWLITPIINLGGTMSVWMKSYSPYYLDTFAIYLTTDLDFDEVEDFNIPLVVKSVAPDEWTEYTADLSAYAGQQGYIAIRHFNSYDRYALLMDDFRVGGEGIMLSNVSSPVELPGLIPEAQNQVQVQAICTSGVSEWSDPVEFTTHGLCDAPYNVNLTEATSNTATIAWTGFQEQYTVRYQTLESFNSFAGVNSTVTLTAGDLWWDGSGYQMLLDADATAYGTIIPESGGLTSSGDVDATVYNEFEYKIPENADGALNTSNIVIDNSVSITIPAGTYDWCITNPSPDDRVWIASNNGSVNGRQDDYEFEAGKSYEFVVTLGGSNDRVDVTITDAVPETSWTTVTNASDPVVLTGLTPNTTYIMKVQGFCADGDTEWSGYFQFTTADEVVPEIPGGCGLVTDCDGKKYPTVKIGDVCWMQKNLAAVSCVTSGNVYAYVNDQFPDEAANVATFGRLYDEEAVMQGIGSGAKAGGSTGICPSGYRLPTVAEIEALGAAYTADELKSDNLWISGGGSASDLSGFSWLPGGCYSSSSNQFQQMLLEGYLWATEEVGGVVSPAMYKLTYYCSTILMRVEDHSGLSASVRCVKSFTCGTDKMKDANGNEYETVEIGTQCWTKSNLRVAPAGATDATSSGAFSNTEPYYYVKSGVDAATNGYYYNWEAAKLACPTGWHLPSDAEWNTLEATVSGSDWQESFATVTGYRGTHAGKLAGDGWNPSSTAGAPGNATDANHNASGFSAVPAGDWDGSSFYNAGDDAGFWSSSQDESSSYDAWYRYLRYSDAGMLRYSSSKAYGFSVRCLRD